MKLRIKGDSLRFRITPSEMRKLIDGGRVEDTVHFGAASDASLTYAVEVGTGSAISLRYQPGEAVVVIPTQEARTWASGDEVGLYARIRMGARWLEVAIEKDWACIDRSDADNADTYPNPHEGAVC